ncbi:MAG: hypothetical protein JSV03_15355 [Planctomycetota bacterium]|nr:MAG: hypothetical protein JSV03_15355 [Planctomycetota bacterium]
MITNPVGVVKELRRRVLLGYNPYYGYDSACDHDVNWLRITPEEFNQTKREAEAERKRRQSQPVNLGNCPRLN